MSDSVTKAWLDGHEFDLQDLAELTADGDIRVLHDSDQDAYYLTAPEIDSPMQPNRFDIPAELLVVQINGLARARDASFRPVALVGKYTTPDGRNHHFAGAHLEVRGKLTASGMVILADGTVQPDRPSPWPARLALASTQPEVAETFEIMGRVEPLGWVELWKVFEIIREAIKPDTLVWLGWVTTADLDSFKESANRKDVSGTDARHARRPGQPKHRPMSLAEGRSFIGALVVRWVATLAGNT